MNLFRLKQDVDCAAECLPATDVMFLSVADSAGLNHLHG